MIDLVIVGAGGFGRELLGMLWDAFSPKEYRLKGFLSQEKDAFAGTDVEARVLADPNDYQPSRSDRFLLAIGNMDARISTVQAIGDKGGRFLSFIHPQALVAKNATVAEGAVIYPFATVSNASRVDAHVHLNYYASIGHDCCVGPYCLLAPYATLNGFCTLEEAVYVSTHATVAPGRQVGKRSTISANSAVMQNAPTDSFLFGVPARRTGKVRTS